MSVKTTIFFIVALLASVVAKAAKVDYFIRTMPHGYDTMLDNEAANLSAGQR